MRALNSNELGRVSGGLSHDSSGGLVRLPLQQAQMSNENIFTLPTVRVTGTPVSSGAIVGSVTFGWGSNSFTYRYDTGQELAVRTVQLGVTLMALPLGGLPAIGIGMIAAQGMRSLMGP